jgi:hypothetical protein
VLGEKVSGLGLFCPDANEIHSLAMAEMKILLREVYSQCSTRVSDRMHGSMELDDQIISSRPKDQTCLLVFEKVNTEDSRLE